MMKGIVALLIIAAIVMVSGCVNTGGNAGGGNGIIIKVFEPSLRNIESGDDLSLHLEVQNTGDYNDAPVVAELTGIDLTEWNVIEKYKPLGTIEAPDKESGTTGGIATTDWYLKAPMLRRGQTLTYTPIARVYYYYKTTATKPLWFVTTSELEKIVREGGSLTSEPTVVTNGPLRVDVRAGNFVRSSNWKSSKFQLQIHIENVGGGYVAGKDNPVFVEVMWPSGVVPVGSCPKLGYNLEGVLYENVPPGLMQPSFGVPVKLWNGKNTDITCEFQIVQPPTNKEKRNFVINLGYIYYTDKETQVTVKGMEEFI